ncbi:hypothetical protein SHK09_04295 [Polaribacter sp. PL03]|uniref:hypothetical protein n=1 Tax=Polaribacter sp. PL03 TaxID=3088353 RepID=UPI0029D38DA5|nr:hypothetical protein [Polaribacter sp. PL03]MDX6746001.1 hypothetical protein [Polaribacter sp. PL03]
MFFAIYSCENPLTNFKTAVDSAIFDKNITISILDPTNPERLYDNNNLKVTLLGDDAAKIISDGGSKTKFTIVDGIVQLAVNPNETNEDLSFLVKISGDNYLTTTIPVRVQESDTLVNISANIVNISNPADGISIKEVNQPLQGGSLTNLLSVKTDDAGFGETTEVTIEKDTKFKDANGNIINVSGDLIVRVVNFDSQNNESLNSFPGGFSPYEVALENGEINTEGSFSTAGFASIDMFVGGTEVKEFTKPITVAMEIDRDVINPSTGQNIKSGDELPVWSYSKDDGKWVFHATTIVQEKNGKLISEYKTTHLSWYNLDYWIRGCDNYRRFDVKVTAPGIDSNLSYRLVTNLVYAGTNQGVSYKASRSHDFYDGKSFGYYRTPNSNLEFVIYDGESTYNKGNEIYRSSSFNGCNSNQININLDEFKSKIPAKSAVTNVNVNFSGICKGKTIKPSSYLYMKVSYNYRGRMYTSWKNVGYINRGKIKLYSITLNKEYEFRTYYRGSRINQKYTFTSDNVDLDNFQIPDNYCSNL